MSPSDQDGASTRNMFLAIGLSMLLLFGFQFFVTGPQERQRAAQRAATAAQQATATPNPAFSAPAAPASVDEALAAGQSARVRLDSPSLDGSILLRGARIDDVQLKAYRTDLTDKSKEVRLFFPDGAAHSFYASHGWASLDPGVNASLPGPDSLWTQTGAGDLTPATPLTLRYDAGNGLVFTRTIAVDAQYLFTVIDRVVNAGSKAVAMAPYGVLRRLERGPDYRQDGVIHQGPISAFERKLTHTKYGDLDKGRTFSVNATGGWTGITDKYWLAALIPGASEPVKAETQMRALGGARLYEASYLGAERTLAPGATFETTTHVLAGAKRVAALADYSKTLSAPRLDAAVHWGMFWFLTRPFFSVLAYFGELTGNYGVAILILTVIVKACLFPLANFSFAAMAKLKRITPMMKELQEQYASDKVRQQQEIMKLYQREKVNPIAGCWPMLLQIPVFWALYKVLYISLEMRHAPFFGWINDLSARDPTTVFNLFGLLPFDPTGWPLVGGLLWVGVLPLLYGLSMFVLMSLNPPATDPIQQTMFRLMPWLFTFMFASFAAGLVLYWVWSNALTIVQQYVIMRRHGVETGIDTTIAKLRALSRPKPQT